MSPSSPTVGSVLVLLAILVLVFVVVFTFRRQITDLRRFKFLDKLPYQGGVGSGGCLLAISALTLAITLWLL